MVQRYEEAVQHILDALVLQSSDEIEGPQSPEATKGVTSSALWESLKTTCLHLQKPDLAALCDSRDLSVIRTRLQSQVDV
jgi:peroxin-5